MDFLQNLIETVKRIIGIVEGVLSGLIDFLTMVRTTYPGLIELMVPLIGSAQAVIDAVKRTGGTEAEIEEAQDQAREDVITQAKELTSGSPRAVPEHIIRMTLEAIVEGLKFEREGVSRYEAKEIRDHAVDILSKYGGGFSN